MRRLFAHFVDDAAMFPPGNATAAAAIAAHRDYRDGPWNSFVGPLLIPAAKWADFTAAYRAAGSEPIAINVLGASHTPDDLPDGVEVAGFELAITEPPVPQPRAGQHIAVEITSDEAGTAVLDAIATIRKHSDNIQAKFRTGGTESSASPDESTLAEVLIAAIRHDVPLKFTAGLHHAIRHTAAETGFEHHGFLNVMLATHQATIAREEPAAVVAALAERDGGRVAAQIESLSNDQHQAIRAHFTSFGCCGVGDPISDLIKLGLISEDCA